MTQAFAKASRLRQRREFLRINRWGEKRVGSWIIVDVLQNSHSNSRLGVTPTKRFGKACTRNRFKRIVREAYRRCQHRLPQGIDINVRPRSRGQYATSTDIENELLQLLHG